MTVNKVEIDEMLASFGGSAGKLVELTLIDADRFIEEISAALEANDAMAVSLGAHSLKSIMKQIGATSVSDIAFEMEQFGKEDNIEACSQKWPALAENYKATREYLVSVTRA